jgi:chromosome segregation ATPase
MAEHALPIIQGLTAIILAVVGWWLARLDRRVTKLEEDVAHYEANVGIGNEKLESIHREISDHVRREEEHVWKNVSDLKESMGEVKVSLAAQNAALKQVGDALQRALSQATVHERDSSLLKERVVRIETRMDKIENGSKQSSS